MLCAYLDKEVGASHNLGLVGLGLVAAELPAYLLLQGGTDLQRKGIRALAVPRKGRASAVPRKSIRALVVSRNQGISCAQERHQGISCAQERHQGIGCVQESGH